MGATETKRDDQVATGSEAIERIIALCESPHWTSDRRWRILTLMKLVKGEYEHLLSLNPVRT